MAATDSRAKRGFSALAPLRDDILAGDYRALYLAWLLAAAANEIDEELEPPVPPGLKELSAPAGRRGAAADAEAQPPLAGVGRVARQIASNDGAAHLGRVA